jgi:hypothetical protein
MSYDHQPISPIFRIDVSPDSEPLASLSPNQMMADLLRQLVVGQAQQNSMLETLIRQNKAASEQRAEELSQWRGANSELASKCRSAAEILSRVQAEFLNSMVDEINENDEYLIEGDFMMNDFLDRFGPRMAHLNGVLQVLAQLGSEGQN